MKKQFILDSEALKVIGEDASPEKIRIIKNSLTNNWAFIVYPESCPDNFMQILEENYIPFAVSPLHDKDFNADGEPKKAHYHILLCSESKKSFTQLYNIAKSVNGTNLINVQSAKGYYRYFAHLDNPEKAQYDINFSRCFCGFEPENYIKPSSTERRMQLRAMCIFIRQNNITEFCQLADIAMDYHFEDWFTLLCDNSTVYIKAYIDSYRNMSKNG